MCYAPSVDALLHEHFLAALEPAVRPRFSARRDLRAELQRLCEQAEAELGEFLEVDAAVLLGLLAVAVEEPEELEAVAAGDLYLASACARHDGSALRCFESRYGPDLDRAVGRSPTLGLSRQEFRQLVFVRLFVEDGPRRAKISSYRGRGSLRAWIRVLASRLLIDLSRRRAEPRGGDEALLERLEGAENTELEYLRRTYGPQLKAAFAAAVTALSVRQRNLLRQRYLHEVSSTALAGLYAVHRSTLYVWLEQARAVLLENARAHLARGIPSERLESVLQLMGSQLEISVRGALGAQLEAETAAG